MVGEWYAFGFLKAYKHSLRCTTETISQIVNFFAIIYYFSNELSSLDFNYSLKLFELVVFIRMLRILTLLYELQTFRIIIETIKNLLGPFYSLLLVQFTIFYVFGLVGVYWFGGRVASTTMVIQADTEYSNDYYLNNFNDLGNGFITLFALMVVNNWQDVSQVFVDITGTQWTLFYFIAFYYLSVVIGLNIVVAFAIDMFGAI